MSGDGRSRNTAAASIRVWDLPTRIFHWLLAILVIFSIVSARIGGGAMNWHMQSGYFIFTLLAFRLVWGFVGGRWSRFATFFYPPSVSLRYLRGASLPHEHHHVGHNPLGAWLVFALLGVLAVQVATGLVADDEISSNGPLLKYVSSATSSTATHWHKNFGQWIIVALVVLHVGAIAFYWLKRRQNLVAAMLHGDKLLTADVPATVDTAGARAVALAIAALCAFGVAAIVGLGS
ncbi:MAG: cytochrome b/b6 domain-containing protein [Pseudomonadota bacterium]|nr:cytochrome b/b6 domain-containing protein [Pseudomonadota bacterium]